MAITRRYQHAFTNVTRFVIPGATHHLDTQDLSYQVTDTNCPDMALDPVITIDPVTFDVTVIFGQPQSGSMVLEVPSTQPPSEKEHP